MVHVRFRVIISELSPAQDPFMLLTAVLMPAAEGGFTALNPETGTTTQGETVEEAVANLREATELYVSIPRQSRGL